MEDREGSYFTTPTFTFIVQGRTFYVPIGLIARLSSPLNRLITSDMKEKHQGFATLGDVTAATFDRFLEWATKGYYTQPLPSKDSQLEDGVISGEPPEEMAGDGAAAEPPTEASVGEEDAPEEVEAFEEAEASDDVWGVHSPKYWGEPPKRRSSFREAFWCRRYSVRQTAIYPSPPTQNHYAEEKYTGIFLCHAQIYVFADAQGIEELKTLALEELHAVLAVFSLYLERTIDVLDLLRFVYANTASLSHGEEPLREMLSDYVSLEMDTLMLDGRFVELILANGEEMLADFMSSVSNRIKSMIPYTT